MRRGGGRGAVQNHGLFIKFFVQGYKKGQGPYNLSKYMYFMSIRMKMCLNENVSEVTHIYIYI